MRTGSKEPLHRRNIVLTQRAVDRIAALRQMTEASTDTEVVRSALALYEKVVESVLSGSTLQIVDAENKVKQIELLVSAGRESSGA